MRGFVTAIWFQLYSNRWLHLRQLTVHFLVVLSRRGQEILGWEQRNGFINHSLSTTQRRYR